MREDSTAAGLWPRRGGWGAPLSTGGAEHAREPPGRDVRQRAHWGAQEGYRGSFLNDAVALVDWFSVTVHLPSASQAPLQPGKVEPVAGIAVRVTLMPLA